MSQLHLYNTLVQKKEALSELEPGHVRIYVCGITAYDEAHVGHARNAVAFDCLKRYLQMRGKRVTLARNITDIDDKIIQRAKEKGIDIHELTEHYTKMYSKSLEALEVLPVDEEPKATEHIPEIIALIQKLMDKGAAYKAGKDIFYHVRNFPGYGKLSHRDLDSLIEGARIEINEQKDDPLDFSLWKGSKEGEPSWESPWGPGRPGWHIECSAMSMKCLGESFDIHGGGQDLVFPHHENEIAQSEMATGKPFAQIWMHNGLVTIDKRKMSKSLGNFFTISEVNAKYSPKVLRYFFIASHYRSPLNFSDKALMEAERGLDRFRQFFFALASMDESIKEGKSEEGKKLEEKTKQLENAIFEAMDDDLNTPKVLGILFEAITAGNRVLAAAGKEDGMQKGDKKALEDFADEFFRISDFLRLFETKLPKPEKLNDEESQLINDRKKARIEKNFEESDKIRKLLAKQGLILEDTPSGVRWKRISKEDNKNAS